MSEHQPETLPGSSAATFPELIEGCNNMLNEIRSLSERLAKIAYLFDRVGDAETHPDGSDLRRLAELRDHADLCLSRAARDLNQWADLRAKTSRSLDLVTDVVARAMGDGHECIKRIEAYHSMMGDDTEGTGQIDSHTFPDQFLWDLAERVEALPAFAEFYPGQLCCAADEHKFGMVLAHR